MVCGIQTASGKAYGVGILERGHKQYMDRQYQFDYVPETLCGSQHIMTCGDDKMIAEDAWCFTVETDQPADVYVLFADKHPVLPVWLADYQRVRMNVTRLDSMAWNLKGYFSLYRKRFPAGEIRFYGNSSSALLDQRWYMDTMGTDYCMYSVAIAAIRNAE